MLNFTFLVFGALDIQAETLFYFLCLAPVNTCSQLLSAPVKKVDFNKMVFSLSLSLALYLSLTDPYTERALNTVIKLPSL